MIAAGVNPVCFDEAIAELMGFAKGKIPTLITAREANRYPLVTSNVEAKFCSNEKKYNQLTPAEIPKKARLNFVPTAGWMEICRSWNEV